MKTTRAEIVAIVGAIAAYVAFHVRSLVPLFGEADGARFAVDAASWHFSGQIRLDTTDYRMRTSPLYIHLLKRAMDFGVSLERLPRLMSWLSFGSSAVTLVAAYFLFRRLVGRRAATTGVCLLVCAPAFWLSGSYGMAHGPAISVWLLALLCFSRCLDETSPRRYWAGVGITTLLVIVALALKADLVLNGLAFPGIAFVRRQLSLRNAVAGCLVVVLGMALQLLYGKSLLTPIPAAVLAAQESTVQFAGTFNKRFPFELKALTDRVGLGSITHAPGPLFFALWLFALPTHLVSRKKWRLGLFAAAWGIPIVLFWGLIIGNSARHNASALPPALLLIGSLLADVAETPLRVAVLGALLATVNYFSDPIGEPHGFGTVVPKTTLLELTTDVATAATQLEAWARGFGRAPGKKAIIARSSLPFAIYEAILNDSRGGKPAFDGQDIRTVYPDGHVRITKTLYELNSSQAYAALTKFKAEGYTVTRHDW